MSVQAAQTVQRVKNITGRTCLCILDLSGWQEGGLPSGRPGSIYTAVRAASGGMIMPKDRNSKTDAHFQHNSDIEWMRHIHVVWVWNQSGSRDQRADMSKKYRD